MTIPSQLGAVQAVECMHPGPLRSVGFGSTVPPHCGTERVARESVHERKAYQEVKAMHERKAAQAQLAGNVLPDMHGFPTPPFPDYPPPPPGWPVKQKPENQVVEDQGQQPEPEACPCAPNTSLWRQMIRCLASLVALWLHHLTITCLQAKRCVPIHYSIETYVEIGISGGSHGTRHHQIGPRCIPRIRCETGSEEPFAVAFKFYLDIGHGRQQYEGHKRGAVGVGVSSCSLCVAEEVT